MHVVSKLKGFVMFRIPETDFYIKPDRYGYHVAFIEKAARKPDPAVEPLYLWQFDDLDTLFLHLPEQLDIFMRTSREATPAMKGQKKTLRTWLLSEGKSAVPRIRRARQVLLETIAASREHPPPVTDERIFATSLVLKPFKNSGYEIYRTAESAEDQTGEFIGYFARYENLLKDLPLLLAEEDFSWRDVGARDAVSQYETCVNWTRFIIDPATSVA